MMSKPQFVGEKVKLGELCDVCSGGTPKRSVSEYWNEGSIPWVKIGDISSKFISSTEEQITEAGLKSSSAKLLAPGTLLYSIFASIGAVGILDIPAATNQAIAGLHIKTDRIQQDYLYHFLKSQEALAKSSGRGVAQNNINLTILREMEVPVPAIGKQKAIVEQLEVIATQIEQVKTQLDQLAFLAKSRFVEMFGDPATADAKHELLAIGNFADVQTGATPLRRESKYYGGSIPWVKTGEVARNFANGVEENITETAIKETNCKVFPAGAVLVAMYGQGDTRGKAAILPFEAATNQACAAIMPSPAHNEVFLNAQLQLLYEDMRAKSLGGNQKNLSLGIIKSMKVILPPMEAQQEFATFVSQVDKSRFVAQQQIEKLQMLYDSLAQEYFGD